MLDFDQGSSLEFIQAKFKEGIKNQDRSRFLVWAGTGVGSMNRVMPAKVDLNEIVLLVSNFTHNRISYKSCTKNMNNIYYNVEVP